VNAYPFSPISSSESPCRRNKMKGKFAGSFLKVTS
jgi:hypothetical protein